MIGWGAQGRPVAGEATEMDTEELRLRRIQEKNRRNQRKFRARQRVSPPGCFLACAPHLSLITPHTRTNEAHTLTHIWRELSEWLLSSRLGPRPSV